MATELLLILVSLLQDLATTFVEVQSKSLGHIIPHTIKRMAAIGVRLVTCMYDRTSGKLPSRAAENIILQL